MKQLILIAVAACCLAGCRKDYVEGHIETLEVVEVANTSAVLKGSLNFTTPRGNTQIAMKGIVCGVNTHQLTVEQNFTSGVGRAIDAGINEGNFWGSISGLLPNTKYYAKAFVALVQDAKENVFYGNIVEFTTTNVPVAPSVATQAASSITASSARLNGTILYEGYPAYSERGFVYGVNQNLSIENASKLLREAIQALTA